MSSLYGLKFTELTQEEIKKRFENTENSDLINSLGGIIGDEIVINKDLAKLYRFDAPSPSELKQYLNKNYERHPLYANMWKGAKK